MTIGTTRVEGAQPGLLGLGTGRPAHRRLRLRVRLPDIEQASSTIPYVLQPFCDPIRLASEQALVTAPRRAGLDEAYVTRGTSWTLADERSRPVSPALRRLATPVLVDDGVHLYRLDPPRG